MRFADQPLADLSSGMAVARDGFSGNVRFPTSFSSHMRIFFSSGGGDPMLLDSQSSLNATHQQLCEFISSSAQKLTLACDCDGSPAPYEEFLKGLRISKKTGPLMLRLTPDRWLELSGSIENLSR